MSPTTKINLPVLTGLRFIAALSVLIAHSIHAVFRNEATSPFLHQFALQLAYLGLTLFFVLSGCVLTLNYANDFQHQPLKTLRNFWVARFARIYPLYLFCCLLFLAFIPDVFHLLANIFPWNFVLAQGWTFFWVDGSSRALYFFPYAWSISAEVFLYLLLPFITWILLKSKNYRFDIALFILLYTATIFILFKAYHAVAIKGHMTWLGIAVVSKVQFLQWIAYYSPYVHISSFFAGCIVGKYLLRQPHSTQHNKGEMLAWLAAGIYLLLLIFITPPDSQHRLKGWDLPKHGMIYAPFIAAFIFILAKYQNAISTFLCNRFCQLFGETSFSIYLLHPLIAGLFTLFIDQAAPESLVDPARYIRLFTIIIFTLVISFGTYSLIEVPGRRWLRKKLSDNNNATFPEDLSVSTPKISADVATAT